MPFRKPSVSGWHHWNDKPYGRSTLAREYSSKSIGMLSNRITFLFLRLFYFLVLFKYDVLYPCILYQRSKMHNLFLDLKAITTHYDETSWLWGKYPPRLVYISFGLTYLPRRRLSSVALAHSERPLTTVARNLAWQADSGWQGCCGFSRTRSTVPCNFGSLRLHRSTSELLHVI